MKKVYLSRLIKCVSLVLPIVLIVLCLQNLLILNDHNTQRIRDFYMEEENSLDVVFLGASEIYSGFAPGYAYEQHGFTSYMYTISANPGSLYKSQLKEVLSRQNPQLIMVEINGFLYVDNKRQANEVQLHQFTDNIPMSENKATTIFEHPSDNKENFLIPFFKYHSNWQKPASMYKQLRKTFSEGDTPSVIKGLHTYTAICQGLPANYATIPPSDYAITDMAKDYLVTFLEYCRENDLKVVFLNFPRILGGEKGDAFLSRVEEVEQIIRQYDYPFLDLQEKAEEIGIVFPSDFYNTHHLNIYGQQKMTRYLGDLITNEYHLRPMNQSEKNKASWEECVLYTEQYFAYAEQCYRDNRVIWISEDTFMEHLKAKK